MNDNNYVQELRKDIKVIKKDLRAISIKTRTMARALENNGEKDTKSKKSSKVSTSHKTEEKTSWLNTIVKKFIAWIR
tara:strand:+ start:3187 stop:3417 length:231 start_codon:yes stop_codon:yes gene_type:complete